MVANVGGWITALIVGLILYLVAPHTPHPVSAILRIVGIVLLVLALILFLLWIVGIVTGSTVIGMGALAAVI